MSSKPENIKVNEKPVEVIEDKVDVTPVVDSTKSVNNELLKRLMDTGDIDIPGLNVDDITNNIMSTRADIKDTIDSYKKIIDDKSLPDNIRDAAKESLENAKKNYENDLKPQIEESITSIKKRYKEISDGVSAMKECITTMVTNIALPKCLGAVTPNPATSIAESKVFRQQINSQCNALTTIAIEMVKEADKISFKIPGVVETTLISIASTGKLLDKLPF